MSTKSKQGCCNQGKKSRTVSMDHVLIALHETQKERDARIQSLFNFFNSENVGYLDCIQFEKGLIALQIPSGYKNAKELFSVCDANRDGRVDYKEFRRYMDDKELELYKLFQAIDVKHNGCISPEELLDSLVKAGIEINEKELASFMEHIDKNNDGIIQFKEWRDFLFLYPHEATIENIYHHWEKLSLVDNEEQVIIRKDISKQVNRSNYFIAGGIAGAASRTATAPLDRIKVLLQIQKTDANIREAIKMIWKQGRVLGFFRGNGLNILKVAPESAIKFYTYELFKNTIGGEDKADISAASTRLFAGGLSGGVAQASIYPLDLLKTRVQTSTSRTGFVRSRLGTLTKDIMVHEGPRAFYKGLFPSLLGIIPYAGIDVVAYETLKDLSSVYILQDAEPGPLVQLGCGTISGALGATCVYPLQVVRTRMQAERAKTTMSGVFRRTMNEEGYRAFYKGLLPNLLKVVPATSITYMVYEAMKKSLELD